MTERNTIGGFTAAVLSPFIEGWQQMLRIKNNIGGLVVAISLFLLKRKG